MSTKSSVAAQAIALPKGGGALKGIGESFQPDLFTGTGNYGVPVALSPGRNGFAPNLALQYSSGHGNGCFGLGWQLSIPRITRKTEKGLPRYDDNDVYLMSGAEDLVPCLEKVADPESGRDRWIPKEPITRANHSVHCYRPRSEGLFARIEKWVDSSTGDVHWRAITRDNVTSIYGATPASRLADPEDEQRVYEWLLDESFDATGNHILYDYAKDHPSLYTNEDPSLGLTAVYDQNRNATQRYIRRICYGNLPDPLIDDQGQAVTYADGSPIGHLRKGRRYAFEVVFDYGDWEVPTKEPHPDASADDEQELLGPDPSISSQQNPVPVREDRFSSYRARFEVRTLRRCRRILMFHHFAELGGPTLVRSTNLDYHIDADTRLSFLASVTVTGHRKEGAANYTSSDMPPVTFGYSEFRPHEQTYQAIRAQGNDMPPMGLNDPNVALVDLFGDGLPDVLHGSVAGFRYWKNLGGGVLDRPRSMPQIPAGIALGHPAVGFGDMEGDGRADLLVHSGPLPGFFETTPAETWQTFKPYDVFPSFDLSDPNLRLVDLTGDGLPDALMTQDDRFLWFQCLGEKGFAAPEDVVRRYDLDQFPDVYFNDPAGRVHLADMTGSGLQDIVLVHDGRIEYWPNLGYGHFGRRITMENAPHLGRDFDPKRLFFSDLNGTGCADLVYVDFDRVHFWFNQSGNRWSDTETIDGTPLVSDADAIQFADVFGTGTATLVWSYDFSAHPESNYKALDFCGGVKPYVLVELRNNMGATTRVRYSPSTRHFLEDERRGTPWITRLPFPVQVVDKVEVIDQVSKTKLTTTYQYHHGFFDGREREFRGFGRVDQFDTESFEDFTGPSLHGNALFLNNSPDHHVAPVETRSWFHTGVYFDEASAVRSNVTGLDFLELTREFRNEFYAGDAAAHALDPHDVVAGDTPHEAYRALRGAPLRTEVYAHDGSPRAAHPYYVTETRYRVAELQPKDGNRHAVHFRHPIETLAHHYERSPANPRISHALTLQVDAFGNPMRTLAIGYGRRGPDPTLPGDSDRAKQVRTLITYTDSRLTNAINDPVADPDNYRAPLPSETRTYELTGFEPIDDTVKFGFDEWTANEFARLESAETIDFAQTADLAREQKRLIQCVRTLYRRNDLGGFLPLHGLESLALAGETYKLAFTAQLIERVYVRNATALLPDAADVLAGGGSDRGGYVDLDGDGHWWLSSGRGFYSPNVSDAPNQELALARRHFFATRRLQDPFGNSMLVDYDVYDLFVKRTIDAVGNPVTAVRDYRVLQPFRITDPNGNRSEVAFDTLGLVVGTAAMGKATESKGDSLAGFATELSPQQRDGFVSDPLAHAAELLGDATTRIVYDLDRFRTTQEPVFSATLARETHASDALPPSGLRAQVKFGYCDGYGREIQTKMRAEPGSVIEGGPLVNPRWVGTGWTIFNNKGKPVKQFEPFFDASHGFRFDVRIGVASTLFYDPVERVVGTLHPDHTWEKTLFDAWRQETWDGNDTALITDPADDPDVGPFFRRIAADDYLPTWHAARQDGALGAAEQAAAIKTSTHAATPTVAHADSLGRTFLTILHNRFMRNGTALEQKLATRLELDIQGDQHALVDALDRVVMRYDYDMLGTRIHQAGMEAGERWILNDVAGNPIRTWDSREHQFRLAYDALRRPVETFLRDSGGPEMTIGRAVYGESEPNPEARNQRGQAVHVFDQAGIDSSGAFDFKGNVLESTRRFARDYKSTIDWSAGPALEEETFTGSTTYDALSRPVAITSPDGSVYRAIFNEAGLLEKVDINIRGAPTTRPFVAGIDYDAKGERRRIDYGNGTTTAYTYDPSTSRVRTIATTRASDQARLQELRYTYDPAGNVTTIEDGAQQAIFFDNQVATADSEFTYDALYRLIDARGREHIGQASVPQTTWDDRFRVHLPSPTDGQAMRRYTERYDYDAAGNFLALIHEAANGNWTRTFAYDDASLIEATRKSNRLTGTTVNNATETYANDAHGNMIAMPHLTAVGWDFKDQLRTTARQVVQEGTPETTFYVYDRGGQRVRKVTERQNGTRMHERIYLGALEFYRQYEGNGSTLRFERQTLHVMDDKQRIALVETTTVDESSPIPNGPPLLRYQYGNHLGSASLELDGAGMIISYEEYYPYGSTSYEAQRSAAETSLKRYRYCGKERDEETGFNYHGARYYAPWLGRWVSCDPAGPIDGYNLYRVAHCNPVRLVDLSGNDNTETTLVAPAMRKYLSNANIHYAEEVTFDLLDAQGRVIKSGRFDLVFKDPNGRLVIPELKGVNVNKLHGNQAVYSDQLDKVGGRIRFTSNKTSRISIKKGDIVQLTKENYFRMGKMDLNDFEDSLQQLTGGKKIVGRFLGLNGEYRSFTDQNEYHKFLKSKGIDPPPPKPRKNSTSGIDDDLKFKPSTADAFRNATGELQQLVGDDKTETENEIDNQESWGFDIARDLAVGGPVGAFKATFGDPERLPRATAIIMVSPHMFGARGGLGAMVKYPTSPGWNGPPPPSSDPRERSQLLETALIAGSLLLLPFGNAANMARVAARRK